MSPTLHPREHGVVLLHAVGGLQYPMVLIRDVIMSSIESRLRALGLSLPPPTQPLAGVVLPFQFVHVVGRRALISGHGRQNPDGSFALPFGKLGRELTVEQGDVAARMTAFPYLRMLRERHRSVGPANAKRELRVRRCRRLDDSRGRALGGDRIQRRRRLDA
jgi:hypothetical protein